MTDDLDEDPFSLDFTSYVPPPAEQPKFPPIAEQAAQLHAAGDSAQACALIEKALLDGTDPGEEAWVLLFGLYRNLSRRDKFEALALDYATRFEKSPPTWPERDEIKPTTGKDGLTTVSLSGVLGSNALQPLKKLRDMADKLTGVRLDLSRVQDADDTGSSALLETLGFFRKKRKTCVLSAGGKLAATLARRTVTGTPKHEPVWLLLLEIYQTLNRQDAFEETAVNYAVTFEVSPPSWETR